MKVLLKVRTSEGTLWRVVDEDDAVRVMEEYRAIGWDCRVVGEATVNESGLLVG